MNKTGSAAKVKLNSFDDLFGDGQPQAGIEQVQEIALSELHEFKGHPFKVLDDEKMQETVESVREHGVLMPGIARPRAEGGYEIIAGHRRRHACELVGLETMPMFIRNYTDDEATIIMVDIFYLEDFLVRLFLMQANVLVLKKLVVHYFLSWHAQLKRFSQLCSFVRM